MYEFHYDHMISKYGPNLWLCYLDTNSLAYDIKTDSFYEDIAGDVEGRFDMSGYSWVRPPPMGVNKNVIRLMKDELGGRIMTKFVVLRTKLHAYKTLSGCGDKKCKGVKNASRRRH